MKSQSDKKITHVYIRTYYSPRFAYGCVSKLILKVSHTQIHSQEEAAEHRPQTTRGRLESLPQKTGPSSCSRGRGRVAPTSRHAGGIAGGWRPGALSRSARFPLFPPQPALRQMQQEHRGADAKGSSGQRILEGDGGEGSSEEGTRVAGKPRATAAFEKGAVGFQNTKRPATTRRRHVPRLRPGEAPGWTRRLLRPPARRTMRAGGGSS